jgi:hypothetical protein
MFGIPESFFLQEKRKNAPKLKIMQLVAYRVSTFLQTHNLPSVLQSLMHHEVIVDLQISRVDQSDH